MRVVALGPCFGPPPFRQGHVYHCFANKPLPPLCLQVNVGRAGAANLDVIQEVEYVKEEAKLAYLLECLQKTAPPVLVFAENKRDVDTIHEYLLVQVWREG